MQITRRDALRGATAAVVVAGVPVATNAATLGNPDAGLFALIDELESVYREHEKTADAELSERQAIKASLPMPPESIQFGKKRRGRRLILVPSLIEVMRAAEIEKHPERSEQIVKHFDRLLAELHAHEAEIDRLRNSPKVRALRDRLDELQHRYDELVAEIHDTPARTVVGILRKVLASFPSGRAPAVMASVAQDLDRMAGEA